METETENLLGKLFKAVKLRVSTSKLKGGVGASLHCIWQPCRGPRRLLLPGGVFGRRFSFPSEGLFPSDRHTDKHGDKQTGRWDTSVKDKTAHIK